MAIGRNTVDSNTGVEVIRNRYHDNTEIKNGARYTTKTDQNQLTNEDFLELMIEEMKNQDPTSPMDSQALMDSQLKMSQIESNNQMAQSMVKLQASYAASALATASSMIGKIVEDGQLGDDGLLKSYKVETIENKDDELYVNARQLVGLKDALKNSETEELVLYDADGYIVENGEKTNYRVDLDSKGRFTFNSDGTLKIFDQNNELVTDNAITSKYKHAATAPVYANQTVSIPLKNILEVRG